MNTIDLLGQRGEKNQNLSQHLHLREGSPNASSKYLTQNTCMLFGVGQEWQVDALTFQLQRLPFSGLIKSQLHSTSERASTEELGIFPWCLGPCEEDRMERFKSPCVKNNFKHLTREGFQMNFVGWMRGSYLMLEDGVD